MSRVHPALSPSAVQGEGGRDTRDPVTNPTPQVTTPQMLSISFLLLQDNKMKYKAPWEVTAFAFTSDLHQEVYPKQNFFFGPRGVGLKGS